MSFYRLKRPKHENTYHGVVNCLQPIEEFLCNKAYPSLTDVIVDGSSYKGDGRVPAKIPMAGGYDFTFTLHEYSHMIEFAMGNKAFRIGRHNFGFNFPVDSFGYDCPTKCQGTIRELKTVAITGRILYQFKKELGLSFNEIINAMVYDIEAICSFVGDSMFFEFDNAYWGGIDRKSLPYSEQKKMLIKQAFRYVLLLAGNMSWEDIETANKRVKKFVQDKHKRNNKK